MKDRKSYVSNLVKIQFSDEITYNAAKINIDVSTYLEFHPAPADQNTKIRAFSKHISLKEPHRRTSGHMERGKEHQSSQSKWGTRHQKVDSPSMPSCFSLPHQTTSSHRSQPFLSLLTPPFQRRWFSFSSTTRNSIRIRVS